MPLLATLNGSVVDINNNPVPNAIITVALWNYGNNTPTVSSGSIIVTPVITTISDNAGNFTTQVYGNDVISPSGTVYTVTYNNQNRITVSTATYTFLAGQTYNLNSFAPNVTYPVPVAMGPVNATQLQGRNISITAPSDGQVLKWVAANSDWEPSSSGGGSVTSVFGRTGVVAALSGDYSFSQISGTASAAQYVTMVGDSGSGGTKGAVPAPAAGDAAASKFLKADGTWATVAAGVTSVFGRSGAVVAATNDYNFNQLAGNIATSQMNSGTGATGSTFWRGDGTWASVTTGASTWDQLQSAAGNLTLSNAGFTTTFNQTSAVTWLWANTTAASSGTSQSSPIINLSGKYWDGAASQTDSWTVQDVIANGTNGTSTLTFAHSGSTGSATVLVPLLGIGVATSGWQRVTSNQTTISTDALRSVSNGGNIGWSFGVNSSNRPVIGSPNGHIGWSSGNNPTGSPIVIGLCQNNTAAQINVEQNIFAVDGTGFLSFQGVVNGISLAALATPATPTVTVFSGSGASTWGYKVVAKDASGKSIASTEGTVANNASLTGNASPQVNKVLITRVNGAVSYDIYRTTVATSPSTTGLIGNIPDVGTTFLSGGAAAPQSFVLDFGSNTAVTTVGAPATVGNVANVAQYTLTNLAAGNANGCAGLNITITGCAAGNNNGTFYCVKSNSGQLFLVNSGATVASSQTGTATVAGDGTTPPVANSSGGLTLAGALTDSTGSAGSSGQILSSTATGTQWIASSGGGGLSPLLTGIGQRRTGWIVKGDGVSRLYDAVGEAFTSTGVFTTNVAVNQSSPKRAYSTQYQTSTNGTFVGVSGSAATPFWVCNTNLNFLSIWALVNTTTGRTWAGLFDVGTTAATIIASDSPAVTNGYAAFRFSVAAGDTNYKCITFDGTTQTIVDSGIAANTNTHYFLIVYNDSVPNIKFYIDGTLVATSTTHLPVTTSKVYYVVGSTSTAASAAGIYFTGLTTQSDL
jgi:hypothetical protein